MEDACYTGRMPTTRPRHFVTETDDLSAVLDAATTPWPGYATYYLDRLHEEWPA
ncbi:hypothetical protein CLV30_113131 [Haloactinopolyspora alba]|uniref:Uncharacterized protein n=1 Tax=Haloactinopolyspora alba TaxID=648780 RepID=A0A2P8DWQ5_9ACTN|nr:hypothetical protein CLV30_113131 [Haloactinopolyspora alba]